MLALERLCRAAVAHHEYLTKAPMVGNADDDRRFAAIDEELIEAAAAYARSLTPAKRRALLEAP